MSLGNVQGALQTAAVIAVGQGFRLVGENLATPPKEYGKVWAEMFFLPGDPEPYTMGEDGFDWVDGVLQITFHYPLDKGSAPAKADYENLRRTFYAGASFNESGQVVTVRKFARSSGSKDTEDYKVHMRATWSALIPRKGGTS